MFFRSEKRKCEHDWHEFDDGGIIFEVPKDWLKKKIKNLGIKYSTFIDEYTWDVSNYIFNEAKKSKVLLTVRSGSIGDVLRNESSM